MALAFPKVPFPGTMPTNPTLSYGGNTYTFDAGLLIQRIGDWQNDVCSDRWRLYDYEHSHIITDQEAQLLGVQPEALIVSPNVSSRAANDAYLADAVMKNLGSALVAIQLPALDAANAALAKAQQQLASDQAATPQVPDVITADQAIVAAAESQLAAVQGVIAQIETQFA